MGFRIKQKLIKLHIIKTLEQKTLINKNFSNIFYQILILRI